MNTKILGLALALSMSAALGACGGDTQTPPPAPDAKTTTPAAPAPAATTPATTAPTTPKTESGKPAEGGKPAETGKPAASPAPTKAP